MKQLIIEFNLTLDEHSVKYSSNQHHLFYILVISITDEQDDAEDVLLQDKHACILYQLKQDTERVFGHHALIPENR